jgi:L-serine dehydratase
VKTSLFDLYKIGVGPSSSHTMGPMRAAYRFAGLLREQELLGQVAVVRVELYGSLALTGIGHGTDRAVILGLMGEEPSATDPATMQRKVQAVRDTSLLRLAGTHEVLFHEADDLLFHRERMLPPDAVTVHPNGVRFTAFGAGGDVLLQKTFFSIGGGFIVEDGVDETVAPATPANPLPYPFSSAEELLRMARCEKLPISEVVLRNECARRNVDAFTIKREVLHIWEVMRGCMQRGMLAEGILPGGLNVRRRARRLAERLRERSSGDPLAPLDWVTVYAMAVNEENAAGGRVVTAPTNGAAGVIPAVAQYYLNFVRGASEEGLLRFFLSSAAIGILYKENASISGAEVGCQGEVGVACSMAAGGLAAALVATNAQIEHAAEIGMEHNLGMTCDPIGGLVQIPCIERNAMGAVKAIHACRMAMAETEGHKLSLDQVIKTMYETGRDMQSRYKETSLAGLALNVIEC